MQNTTQNTKQKNPLNLSNPALIKEQCFINDGWYAANDNCTIEVSNPFTGDVIGSVPSLTKDDVNEAVAYSYDAQTAWAAKTSQERSVLLQKWADLIDDNKEDLAIIMTAEQGK
ncbi:MAG: aldehyde dehydrogenase family protein, partial [Psychrobacter sp.]|nr:aldehyde dehydrogenase family protein [Psychrobacter sp.]